MKRPHPLILCPTFLLLVFATITQAAEPIPLRAGPLTMMFDADNAFLRYIKAGPYEVLRGINAPVRNQFWSTVRPKVTNLKLNDGGDHFSLTFDATCKERDIDFRWRGTITGTKQGVVEFTFDGTAHSTFMRNRIGLCVLHGPSAAGQAMGIRRTDGTKSWRNFPKFISPQQPAKDIRRISHRFANGPLKATWAHVEFTGEVFEMEDQRNWTDASFKTYCTPLSLAYPVKVAKGTKIFQKVRIHIDGKIPKVKADANRIILTLGKRRSPLPRIGLQVSSETNKLSAPQLRFIKALHLSHLRIDLHLSEDTFAEQLREATRQANALDVKLQIGIHFGDQPEKQLQRLFDELKTVRPPVSAFLCLTTDEQQYQLAQKYLKPVSGKALIGIGNNTNFVDLNRGRPAKDNLEAVAFAINPQIHAFDNASMAETLRIHGDTVRSARQFIGKRPLLIGPVTLRPQQVSQKPLSGALPSDVDVRQSSKFAAAWTLGSIKYLAEAGAESVTYFETDGRKGVINMSSSKLKAQSGPFPSGIFPVYHVLQNIGQFAGGQVQQVESSDSLSVIGLAVIKSGQMRLLIANLTARQQWVGLQGLGKSVDVQRVPSHLGRATTEIASEIPISLPPHGIVRIDRVVD